MNVVKRSSVVLTLFLAGCVASKESDFIEIGDFGVQTMTNPITGDSLGVMITMNEDAPFSNTEMTILSWKCRTGGKLNLILSGDPDHLGYGRRVMVTWSVGSIQPPQPSEWKSEMDSLAILLSIIAPEKEVTAITRASETAKNLALRFTDYKGIIFTYTFGLSGFSEAIARLPCARRI